MDSHSKKRPHNLIFGRTFDHRLYDLLELGVEHFRSIKSFGTAGASVQAGNKVGFHLFAVFTLVGNLLVALYLQVIAGFSSLG